MPRSPYEFDIDDGASRAMKLALVGVFGIGALIIVLSFWLFG
ncbi:MAG TPA: hypothetical protein VG713_15220 [Pirellulales bacterium]|jgi:hypothetical protein|nr:hypothetical protein [Pirellulales bacterium]